MNVNAAPRMGSTAPLALALAQPEAEVQTNVRAAQAPATLAPALSAADVSHVIEMAWADEIAFEAIALQYGLNEAGVIRLMRRHLKPGGEAGDWPRQQAQHTPGPRRATPPTGPLTCACAKNKTCPANSAPAAACPSPGAKSGRVTGMQ